MEKKKAHYSLTNIQKKVQIESQRIITTSALQGAYGLGFSINDIILAVCSLVTQDLYKSMTTNQDSTHCQDVYHKNYNGVDLYIKLQLIDKAVVISFKEL